MSDQAEMLMFLDEAERYILGIASGDETCRAAEVVEKLRALVRQHVRPAVAEVLPLAIEYHTARPSGLWDFFHHRDVSDNTLNRYGQDLPMIGDEKGERLLRLLLEMSPTGRRKVSRQARGLVGLREFEAMRSAVPDPQPTLGAWNRTSLEAAVDRVDALRAEFRFPDPMPTHIVDSEGVRCAVEAYGYHPNPWLNLGHPRGYRVAYYGDVLRTLFAPGV